MGYMLVSGVALSFGDGAVGMDATSKKLAPLAPGEYRGQVSLINQPLKLRGNRAGSEGVSCPLLQQRHRLDPDRPRVRPDSA
jgi:hypothetical protein